MKTQHSKQELFESVPVFRALTAALPIGEALGAVFAILLLAQIINKRKAPLKA